MRNRERGGEGKLSRTWELRLPGGDEGVEEIPHVVEAREVDMAVLLPLVPLALDRVPLILQPPMRPLSWEHKWSTRERSRTTRGGRGGSLRGCCRRLASSPSASAPASAAAAVARGKLGTLGVSTRGGGSTVSPPSPARAPKFIRQNRLIARAARRPAVGTRQCGCAPPILLVRLCMEGKGPFAKKKGSGRPIKGPTTTRQINYICCEVTLTEAPAAHTRE